MQLDDLVKPLSALSDEDLMERLRQIRHNRTVARPAAAARKTRESNKGRVTKIHKTQGILSGLSNEALAQLLAELYKSNAKD